MFVLSVRVFQQELCKFSTRMNGQAKISAFFGSSQNKRTAATPKTDTSTAAKKLKADNPEAGKGDCKEQAVDKENLSSPEKCAPPSGLSLTPEQKSRMEAHKRAAEARLQGKSGEEDLGVNMGETWRTALQAEFSKPYFKQLSKFVAEERKKGKVYPPADQVFAWTQMCPVQDVKVVILGQDPYHGPNQAHGLCFSVQKGVKNPPSLANIYKELTNDIEGFKNPGHGTLTGWAKQGVLLLNACLTVRAHQANSHAGKGWEKLTDATITWINKNSSGVVFMLWGGYAQKKGACIDKERHHVLTSVHPSPLSAHRGFLGCKHFSQCNKLLTEGGKTPVDWTKLPPE